MSLFALPSILQEVFDIKGCKACGQAGAGEFRFQVRVIDSFEFFEVVCCRCTARMQYGQNKVGGGLFPKGDWAIYKPD